MMAQWIGSDFFIFFLMLFSPRLSHLKRKFSDCHFLLHPLFSNCPEAELFSSCTVPINQKAGLRQADVFPWVLGFLAPEPEVLVLPCLDQLPLVYARS